MDRTMIYLLTGALLSTIVIECGVLLLLGEKRRRVYLLSAVVNVVTNLPLNLYLMFVRNTWPVLLFGEVMVVVFEAAAYYGLVRNKRQALVYSLLCNAISFLVGALIQLMRV